MEFSVNYYMKIFLKNNFTLLQPTNLTMKVCVKLLNSYRFLKKMRMRG